MSATRTEEKAPGALELTDIDLEFGRLVCRLAQSDRPELALAAALASHATGSGDVCVRLADFAGESIAPFKATAPLLDAWLHALRKYAVIGDPGAFSPLVLDSTGRLYLYRYWDYERRLADALLARAVDAAGVDEKLLHAGLSRHFPDPLDREQKLAAATALLRRFCVISGGPGTGKTTTVVKILALLAEQARGRQLAIGLAAPTGKAAARVQEAIGGALERLDLDLFARACVPREASTIHRLLGARPDGVTFRHGPANPLPLDVLVVDEASMADLALAAKLVEALPRRARLILLGDKDQLASVEAGSVLGDVCRSSGFSAPFAKRLASVTGVRAAQIPTAPRGTCALSDSIALLERSYRFGPESGIGTLARRVNAGEAAEALALAESGDRGDVAWRSVRAGELRAQIAAAIPQRLRAYFDAVRARETPQAILDAFDAFRVLCAHRAGLFGAAAVNRLIEEALDRAHFVNGRDEWYVGRPVMVTRNDYGLRLFNGDVGVTLPDPDEPGRLKVFVRSAGGALRAFAPLRLPEHETVYAMTIHKSQGSEFGEILMVLPDEISPVITRELVYTGITRAKRRVEIWGTAEVFREGIARRITRASALQERLWQAC